MSLQQIFRKELEKIQVDNRYISEQVKKGKCVNPSAQYILIIQKDNKDLIERIESREGLRQLSYMKELKMGNPNYELVSID